MRIGEPGRFRRDDQVARQREFEPAGIAMAMHRGDHRLRQVGKPFDGMPLEMRRRRPLAVEDIGEIVARGKTLASAADDDQPNAIGLLRDTLDVGIQRDQHLHVDRVQFLGAVQRQRCQSIFVFAEHQFGHGLFPPIAIAHYFAAIAVGKCDVLLFARANFVTIYMSQLVFEIVRAKANLPQSGGFR